MHQFFSSLWDEHAMPLSIGFGVAAGLLLASAAGIAPGMSGNHDSKLVQVHRPNMTQPHLDEHGLGSVR